MPGVYYFKPLGEDIIHYGVKGMKWGVRRYQKKDGSLTSAGKKRYADKDGREKQGDDENSEKVNGKKLFQEAESRIR